MSVVTFDRALFAFTIGSHIIIVSVSISIILFITILEGLFLFRRESRYSELIYRLKRVFVISFGVGTASGIVMAVELVNLFPGFMTLVSETGAINLFYAEVFAFFLETIVLVVYVYFEGAYKWKYSNLVFSSLILLGTLLSAVFITLVNAWMNTPNGFNISVYEATGKVTGVNPWAPFLTSSGFSEVFHVTTTTVFAGVMIWCAYFAYKYLRESDSANKILYGVMVKITSITSIVAIILAGVTGSGEMATLLSNQQLKYAALDANYFPGTNVSERLFGSIVNGHFVGGIQIPGLQSLLATVETGIKVLPGLSQFPATDWPPLWVHTTFDIMVTGGLLLGLFLFILFILFLTKRDLLKYRWLLWTQVAAGLSALVVYEIGWVTDEVGRQPWIVYNVMTVSKAANYSSGQLAPGYFIIAFYLVLIPATFYFYDRIFHTIPESSLHHRKRGVEH